jgi:nucleotide-binding universal stress UspA family protein
MNMAAISSLTGGIQKYAEKQAIDMIIMGSHGQAALHKLLLVLVAAKILVTTSLPAWDIR